MLTMTRINDDEYQALVFNLRDECDRYMRKIKMVKNHLCDLLDELSDTENDMNDLLLEAFDFIQDEKEQTVSSEITDDTCYVYFIENKYRDLVKIGITNNVVQRIESLRTACGDDIFLHHYFECSSRSEALEYESKLHKYYAFARIKSVGRKKATEWFKCKEIADEKHIRKWEEMTDKETVLKAIENSEKVMFDILKREMDKAELF